MWRGSVAFGALGAGTGGGCVGLGAGTGSAWVRLGAGTCGGWGKILGRR
jgi:hypothetical protein